MSLRRREKERREAAARELVRGRIVRGIHTGRLRAGDRLASYREVAAETGLDLRAVMRIYQALSEEGLVQVRGRAGVFVATQRGDDALAQAAAWMAGVLLEGWKRRIAAPAMPDFARRCVAAAAVRCACVESTEDHLDALVDELHDDFGFEAVPLHADRLAALGSPDVIGERLPDELRGAHFLATTAFHAAVLRPLARRLDLPLVILRLDPEVVGRVAQQARDRRLVVVCVDPRFVERIRLIVGEENAEGVFGIVAADRDAVERLAGAPDAVLVSHAARKVLGDVDIASILPTWPVLSIETADELLRLLVRFNLEASEPRP